MTKINPTSTSPVNNSPIDEDQPPTPQKTSEPNPIWSAAVDVGAAAFELGSFALKNSSLGVAADLIGSEIEMLEAVPATLTYTLDTASNFFLEGKYADKTLNPAPAIERVVANANQVLEKTFGDEALQITTHPNLNDRIYTSRVLMGQEEKLDQIPTAVAALAVGVLHENSDVLSFAVESPIYKAVAENAGKAIHAAGALAITSITHLPAGLVFKATSPIESAIDGMFDSINETIETVRTQPLLASEKAAAFTVPIRTRLERMPVNDTYTGHVKFDVAIHEGVGGHVNVEAKEMIKKTGEEKYEITFTGNASLLVGLGLGANEAAVKADAGFKQEVSITLEVSGPEAAQLIETAGDIVSGMTPMKVPIVYEDIMQMGDLTSTDVKLTGIEIKPQASFQASAGPIKDELAAELSSKTGIAVQRKFELDLKSQVGIAVGGLPPEENRSLEECLNALVQPSASVSVKGEGSVRFDGGLSAEFKLGAASGMDRIEASIKLEVKDFEKLADHLDMTKEELKNISADFLFEKLGSIPPDAAQISVEVTGYDGYLGGSLEFAGAEYSLKSEHPTTYLKIPDPENPNADMETNLKSLRNKITELAEGFDDERPVALKA